MAVAQRTGILRISALYRASLTSRLALVALLTAAILPYWCAAAALLNAVHIGRQLAGIR